MNANSKNTAESGSKSFRRVASVAAFQGGDAVKVEVDGKAIAIFRVADGFIATTDKCPHAGGPLHEGELDGNVVTCPWHGLSYSLDSGACIDDPNFKIERYAVQVEGDDILLRL